MHISHVLTLCMFGGRNFTTVFTIIYEIEVFGVNVVVDNIPCLVTVVTALTVPQLQTARKFQDFNNFIFSLCICN